MYEEYIFSNNQRGVNYLIIFGFLSMQLYYYGAPLFRKPLLVYAFRK